jgi:hypothetical protein
MKKVILAIVSILTLSFSVNAQYKKDGTPDMRFSANKQLYGNSYSAPSPSYSPSTYSTPSSSYSLPSTTYSAPKVETYTTPNNSLYSQPREQRQTSYPSYPQTKSGAPDMRYKENKQLYGRPY